MAPYRYGPVPLQYRVFLKEHIQQIRRSWRSRRAISLSERDARMLTRSSSLRRRPRLRANQQASRDQERCGV